jgi:hypothetical protein
MSKRKKNTNKARPSTSRQSARSSTSRKWRDFRQFSLVFILLAGVVGSGLAAFKYSYDASHDLAVIGKGVPAIVQIHDPNCPLCNQLRSAATSAANRFGDRLLYRIADIKTPQGSQLQRRHDVPHVTLLLFDGKGELRRVLTGVKSDDVLYRAFEAHLKRWGPDREKRTEEPDAPS